MPNESSKSNRKRAIKRFLSHENKINLQTDKSHKFRWSTCFSFINKFKKSDLNNEKQIRLTQSLEDFDPVPYTSRYQNEPIDSSKAYEFKSSSLWKPPQPQLAPSLSPPPRQVRSRRPQLKKEENSSESRNSLDKKSRNLLIDSATTPKVRPRSVKKKGLPSALRLSIGADFPQSIDTANSDSCVSLTPTGSLIPQAPFRSGTLGSHTSSRPTSSLEKTANTPPLPPISSHILYTTDVNYPKLNTQTNIVASISTSVVTYSTITKGAPQQVITTDSMISHGSLDLSRIEFDDDEDYGNKLTYTEKRSHICPLSIPNADQLALALNELLMDEPDLIKASKSDNRKRQTFDLHNIYMKNIVDDINDNDHQNWNQQNSDRYFAQTKSRQDTLSRLEGVSVQDFHSSSKTSDDDVKVTGLNHSPIKSRTTSSIKKRKESYDEKEFSGNTRLSSHTIRSPLLKDQPVDLKTMNENNKGSLAQSGVILYDATETLLSPALSSDSPLYQKDAPSLISSRSTPNSIDSSVLDHDEFIGHGDDPIIASITSLN